MLPISGEHILAHGIIITHLDEDNFFRADLFKTRHKLHVHLTLFLYTLTDIFIYIHIIDMYMDIRYGYIQVQTVIQF